MRELEAQARGQGHEAVTPVLPPLGDVPPPTYAELAQAAAQAAGEAPAILVAHSAAGGLVPAVAEAMGEALIGAVYMDAALPHPGRSWFNTAPPELADGLRAMARDGLLPPWDAWFPPGALARLVPDAELLAPVTAELQPLSLDYFDQPAPVLNHTGPSAYLRLSSAYNTEAVKARNLGWPTGILDLHHLAMLTHPAAVLASIVTLVEQWG
jgi:hypothetical protein